MPRKPKGPFRHSSTVTKRPTTTGGRPMPVFMSAMTRRLPGNSLRATATATPSPSTTLRRVAIPDTFRESRVIPRTSGSSVSSSSSAFRRPSQIKSTALLLFRFEERELDVHRRREALLDGARRSPADQVQEAAGLVVGPGGAGSAEGLVAHHGARGLVVDVEV